MTIRLLAACLLMALCVTIHASGLAWALKRLRRSAPAVQRFPSSLRLFIRMAIWIVLLHLSEIGVWAAAYTWNHALPNIETALYFSAVTYTTTGYGDVVLPAGWRLDGGVEALTGILMCGWSTGFFFAVVNRLYDGRPAAVTS
jgi:ion channel